jgi:cytochrome c heme-lyase
MSGGNTQPYVARRCSSFSFRSPISRSPPSPTDVIDYYHLADDAEGNPVFSLDVRPAVDDLESVQERVGEWWKLKKETIFGSGESSNLPPGVRVQE